MQNISSLLNTLTSRLLEGFIPGLSKPTADKANDLGTK